VADVVRRLRPDVVQSESVPGLSAALVTGVRFLPVVHDGPDLEVDVNELGPEMPFVLEAAGRGGRGIAPDAERAAALARRFRIVLAGGLTPENVATAIHRVRPFAVDVSSGVESSLGVKDPERIRRFVDAVRGAER
jgi:phosphoribosylanthranilate isomerase